MSKCTFFCAICSLLVLVFQNITSVTVVIVNLCENESFKVVHMETVPKQREMVRRPLLGPLEFDIIENVDVQDDQDIWVAGKSWRGSMLTGVFARFPGIEQKGHYHKLRLSKRAESSEQCDCIIFIDSSKKSFIGGMVDARVEGLGKTYLEEIKRVHNTIKPEIKEIESLEQGIEESFQYYKVKEIFERLRLYKREIEKCSLLRDVCPKVINNIDTQSQKFLEVIHLLEGPKQEKRRRLAETRKLQELRFLKDKNSEVEVGNLGLELLEEEKKFGATEAGPLVDIKIIREGREADESFVGFARETCDVDKIAENLASVRQAAKACMEALERDLAEGIAEPVIPYYFEAATRGARSATVVPVEKLMRNRKLLDTARFAATYSYDALETAVHKADSLQNKWEYYRYTPQLRRIADVCKKAMKRQEVREITS